MSTSQSFDAFYARVQSLFANDQLVDAWEALVQDGSLYDDHRGEVDYLRMCVTARMGKPELAAHILEGALDAGFWYSEELLNGNAELESLRSLPGYPALLSRSLELMAKENELVSTPIIKEPQVGSDTLPLLMALHDDDLSAKKQHKIWLDLGEHGYLMTFLQAKRAMMRGIYRWGSTEEAALIARDILDEINRAYWVDMDRVLLGGIGRGGQLAIGVALSQALPCRGFIAIQPTLAPEMIEEFIALLEKPAGELLRGVIIDNAGDDPVRDALLKDFIDRAVALGLTCRRDSLAEKSSAFRAAASRLLPSAAAFIMNKA